MLKIENSSNTFKCWLIANFEIAMILLTFIIGSIIFWGFGGIKKEGALDVYVSVFGLLLLTIPTKRGVLQFGKYILMLVGIILLMWGIREGWITDVLWQEKFSLIITWFWIIFSVATVMSCYLAYYTFVNVNEVVSRRMIWRNSNVSLFEYTWLYTLDRFCNITVSIVTCTIGLILIIKII
jgi:hypothetical protein